jgi:hypothetical protein
MICNVCQYRKQVKISLKAKNQVSINHALQLLYMDLFGPIHVSSLSGKRYAFVIANYYNWFTCVLFLTHKDEVIEGFLKFCKRI